MKAFAVSRTMPWRFLIFALVAARYVGAMNETCVAASIKRFTTCSADFVGAVDPGISANFLDVLFGCSGREQDRLAVSVSGINTTVIRGIVKDVTPVLASANLTINVTFQQLSQWVDANLVINGSGWGAVLAYDAWILNPMSIGTMVEADLLQDISAIALGDPHMQWQDIHPFYRLNVANYGGKVVVLPMDGQQWLMYVRHDVLAQHSLDVPRTWDELLAVAAAVNGTDMNNDGVKDCAVCLTPCLITFMLSSIWVSIVQTHGMHQGMHYDINTMQVMLNTSGMAYALELFQKMFAFTNDISPVVTGIDACLAYEPKFADGKCAITFGSPFQFKRNSRGSTCNAAHRYTTCTRLANTAYVRGLVTTAPVPGSPLVLNRTSGSLEPCNKLLCPYATAITMKNGSTQSVNYTPWSGLGGAAAGISKLTNPLKAYYAWFFMTWFTYPKGGIWCLLNPDMENGPFRLSHLDETLMKETYGLTYTDPNLVGYAVSDTTSFLSTLSAALSHPNVAMEMRMPNMHLYRSILQFAAFNIGFGRQSVAAVMKQLAANSALLLPKDPAAIDALRRHYWISLNYMGSTEPTEAPSPSPPSPVLKSTSAALSVGDVVGIIVGIVTALLILVPLGYCYLSRHRSLWSVILPPKAGPKTTLLVTDIENSTVLWETCDTEVMDATLKQHHGVVRKALLMYGGYESATEGDAFIVAFPSAHAALQFSLHVQLKLLEASWPTDLDAVPASLLVSTPLLSRRPSSGIRTSLLSKGRTSWTAFNLLAYGTADKTLSLRWRPQSCSTGDYSVGSATRGDESALQGSALQGTVRDCLAAQYPIADGSSFSNSLPLYRGLRVRIGFHSGVAKETDININAASGRTIYSGDALAVAKSVGNSAHGGQIMLSEDALAALEKTHGRRGLAIDDLPCMFLDAGLHKIKGSLPPCRLYIASPPALHARLALFKPVRSLVQLAPGVLEAPLGMVAAAVVSFPGVTSLLAWNAAEARRALTTFEECCFQLAWDNSGFPTVSKVGEITCAFRTCAAAVEWALAAINAVKAEPWSDELLSHPLCEPLWVNTMADESALPPAATSLPPSNGLRIKQLFQRGSSSRTKPGDSRRHAQGLRHASPGPSLLYNRLGSALPTPPPSPSPLAISSSGAAQREPKFSSPVSESSWGYAGLPSMSEEGSGGSPASDLGVEPEREVRAACTGSVLFRGPRIKAGVAYGDVYVDICGTNGSLQYGGKAVALANSVAAKAKSSQVLCLHDVSQRVAADVAARPTPIGHAPILCTRLSGASHTTADTHTLYRCCSVSDTIREECPKLGPENSRTDTGGLDTDDTPCLSRTSSAKAASGTTT